MNWNTRLSRVQECIVPLQRLQYATRRQGQNELTAGVTNLDTSLADMDRDNFTHSS